jgi:hypothetical protein
MRKNKISPRSGFLIITLGVPLLFSALYLFVSDTFEKVGLHQCDVGQGFSSCSDGNWALDLLASLLLANVLVLLSRVFVHKYGHRADYIAGVLYLWLVGPVTWWVYSTVVDVASLWGNARGAFNDTFIPVLLIVNVAIFLLIVLTGSNSEKS